jgi:hypothetical protein
MWSRWLCLTLGLVDKTNIWIERTHGTADVPHQRIRKVSGIVSRQAIQWQSLESVTWALHVAVGHLETERGAMVERLSFCTRQLSMLQPRLLRLPGSLTQEFIQLINDLEAGRYDHDPFQGDAAIRKYYGILQVALLDALPIE